MATQTQMSNREILFVSLKQGRLIPKYTELIDVIVSSTVETVVPHSIRQFVLSHRVQAPVNVQECKAAVAAVDKLVKRIVG